MMGKKEDMKAALECRQPSQAVPIWEIEFHAWDQASSRHIILGEEFAALSPADQERALYANAALSIPTAYWEIAPEVPAYYWLPGEARFRQIEVLQEVGVGDLMLVGGSGGVMAMPGANDYVEFAYKLFDAPEEIDQRARQSLQAGLGTARRLCDLGIEAMFTASDIADNSGVYFNPKQMERFILPYLRKWAEEIRNMDCYAILHTDGDISCYLEDIANSGLHALQAIDPVAGMDIRKVKGQIGDRLCLCGNVDCGLLLNESPEEVYTVTRDLLLDCKAGGGLVLGASNAVQQEVPIENYQTVIRAWEEYGKY
jgi:uroporphyrinogen decarboxylase